MESSTSRQLVDKIYEKRKAAALELEKQIRECHYLGDNKRISQIIDQLVDMFNNPSNALHIRNGGLIGLAGTAIALGVDIAPYMDKFIEPLLVCFTDPENRIRYFSAECLYNIAKVSKGEILVYFNTIFDALSKLAADSELSVKNGAELLDRLLKDIVAESASVYIPYHHEIEKNRDKFDEGVLVPHPDGAGFDERKAFSLAQFIPLLADRIYVVSPFTRSYLVSWIVVLDSVPELELITYLPEFLDGLLKYLSDPTPDVRIATENLLGDFLREIRSVSNLRKRRQEATRERREEDGKDVVNENHDLSSVTVLPAEQSTDMNYNDISVNGNDDAKDDVHSDVNYYDPGDWVPGQGVKIDYDAIVKILLEQIESQQDEIQQSVALHWLSEFIQFANEVMVPFTPRLIPVILPNLAHHASMIQNAAMHTNALLMDAIQALPSPAEISSKRALTADKPPSAPNTARQVTGSPTPTDVSANSQSKPTSKTLNSMASGSGSGKDRDEDGLDERGNPIPAPGTQRTRSGTSASADPAVTTHPNRSHADLSMTQAGTSGPQASRSDSPLSWKGNLNPGQSQSQNQSSTTAPGLSSSPEPAEPFDYQATVIQLTIQFPSDYVETRVAALRWLIMLHQKSPKILAMDDATFPALLKTLSDESEEVIKHDLQLLAQISSNSEESYFKRFMENLLELFSTDRKLLENRGSFIIRQLCANLNPERIYRTFAEILEKEEDLEFASVIVQKLNIILITAPELAEFRKRLKSLETRQDGQALFTTLYRSWCHNAVAVFSLCLLAQAYEHASNLLSIFADLEITVQMLIQVDKLVQLIESPVFTYLRLQLLEQEKYPYLTKCLYGLLMVLPQSSAFISLRNRLNAINTTGFPSRASSTATAPTLSSSTRSKFIRSDDIKWQDLLNHFRAVQAKHEKARRQSLGDDDGLVSEFPASSGFGDPSSSATSRSSTSQQRPGMRKQVTSGRDTTATGAGQPQPSTTVSPRGSGALSPLNPRSRTQASGSGMSGSGTSGGGQQRGAFDVRPHILNETKQQAKRVLSLGNGKK